MKEGMKFSLSVGAFLTLIVYVAGFTWQYTYLGVITNDIGWIRVVTTDYIHKGIMAIMFVMDTWQFILFGAFIAAIFSGLFDGWVIRIWKTLPHKYKLKLHSCFTFAHYGFVRNVTIKKFAAFLFTFVFLVRMMLEISAVSAEDMAHRLMSEGVDKICHKDESCYEGKVLYISDKQIYFYSFEDRDEITEGALKLVSVADWTVTMAWNEKGREVINKHITAGS